MKKLKLIKKFSALATVLAVVGTMSIVSFAAKYNTPAEAISGLTNKDLQTVVNDRYETGKTYGQMAYDAGVFDEYQKHVLEMKKDHINSQVSTGRLDRAQADSIIKSIEENQAVCNGTGNYRNSTNSGQGFGCGGRFSGGGFCGGYGQGQAGRFTPSK